MDEAAARRWLSEVLNVPRGTFSQLERLAVLVAEENERQNLVSRASLDAIWARHIVDSAQLMLHAPARIGHWLDLGTGAGFPGVVVAMLHDGRTTLVESRRKRSDFLAAVVIELGLAERVTVAPTRLETVPRGTFDVISARAFAPLDRLLTLALPFSSAETRWLLPKGQSAASEVEAVRASWQGGFRLVASVTDPNSAIVIAEGVSRRSAG